MAHPKSDAFSPAQPSQPGMSDIIAVARHEISMISQLPIDGVTRCEKDHEGQWRVEIELLESAARMGDNDLLSSYELRFDPFGTLVGLVRLGRYNREDKMNT